MQHVRVWRDRGLQVEDEAEAVHYLTYIGYYRLSGYSRPLMRHGTGEAHKFKEGARFTNILDLYRFDRELRLIMMDAIERIEVAFRTVFSNTMACKYGSHCYLEKKLFLFPDNAEWLARKIMDETGHAPEQKRKRDVFFDHYYQKYSSPRLPPTWMVAERFRSMSGPETTSIWPAMGTEKRSLGNWAVEFLFWNLGCTPSATSGIYAPIICGYGTGNSRSSP